MSWALKWAEVFRPISAALTQWLTACNTSAAAGSLALALSCQTATTVRAPIRDTSAAIFWLPQPRRSLLRQVLWCSAFSHFWLDLHGDRENTRRPRNLASAADVWRSDLARNCP